MSEHQEGQSTVKLKMVTESFYMLVTSGLVLQAMLSISAESHDFIRGLLCHMGACFPEPQFHGF